MGGRVHRWLLSSECSVLFEAVEEAKVNAWEVGWAPELIAVRRKTMEEGRRKEEK